MRNFSEQFNLYIVIFLLNTFCNAIHRKLTQAYYVHFYIKNFYLDIYVFYFFIRIGDFCNGYFLNNTNV